MSKNTTVPTAKLEGVAKIAHEQVDAALTLSPDVHHALQSALDGLVATMQPSADAVDALAAEFASDTSTVESVGQVAAQAQAVLHAHSEALLSIIDPLSNAATTLPGHLPLVVTALTSAVGSTIGLLAATLRVVEMTVGDARADASSVDVADLQRRLQHLEESALGK